MSDQPKETSSEDSWTEAPKQYQQPTPPPPAEKPAPESTGNELKDAAQDIKQGVGSAAAKVSSWWKSKGEKEVQDFFQQAGDKIEEAAETVKTEIDETVDDIKTQPPEKRKSVFGKVAGDVQNLFKSKDKPQKPE
jgi:gas vesicle protein